MGVLRDKIHTIKPDGELPSGFFFIKKNDLHLHTLNSKKAISEDILRGGAIGSSLGS